MKLVLFDLVKPNSSYKGYKHRLPYVSFNKGPWTLQIYWEFNTENLDMKISRLVSLLISFLTKIIPLNLDLYRLSHAIIYCSLLHSIENSLTQKFILIIRKPNEPKILWVDSFVN